MYIKHNRQNVEQETSMHEHTREHTREHTQTPTHTHYKLSIQFIQSIEHQVYNNVYLRQLAQ